MHRWKTLTLSTAAFVLASGCSSTHEGEVERVAEQLHAALRVDDGAAACDLLR